MQLTPLLTASPLSGHAISIYAGSFEEGNKPGELPMGCPSPDTYGVSSVRKHTSFMKTFLFEDLAEKNAGRLRLTHIYPGLVDGPTFYSNEMPAWFRIIWTIMKPLLSWYMTSPEDCGLVMLYLATAHFPARGSDRGDSGHIANSTDGVPGGGCYSVGQRADAKAKGVTYDRVRLATTKDQVWKHTMGVLETSSK
ncbi:hypothetical protein C1H76_8980 [Elsinoe australis]|uniref:Uncharacterized protein n=1 Tax=Elsinoe australis TaxID=40998 RepID=A0A4U7ALG5_9PEZI|nr:hypothetical protein C1H76_8980 [Elsinoe australis]